MVAFDRNKAISLVRSRGPVLPVQLTKELNTSPLFVGAILSELVDNKQMKLSHAKIGGSPVYYVEGQESRLPELLYKHLHEKERKAFDLLKSRGIVRDRDEEPVVRVALRAIKDFAIPFEVRRENDVEIFWKYFMISDSEAEKAIRTILTGSPASQEEKKTSARKKKRKNWSQKTKSRKKKSQKSKKRKKSTKNTKRIRKSTKKRLIKRQSSTSLRKKSVKKKTIGKAQKRRSKKSR